MENQHSSRADAPPLPTVFLSEQETAKLQEMLTLSAQDLDRISGGCGCGCCHVVLPPPKGPGPGPIPRLQ